MKKTYIFGYCPECGTQMTNNDVLEFNENTGRLTFVCPFCNTEFDEDDLIDDLDDDDYE